MEKSEFAIHITGHMGRLKSNAFRFTQNLDDADDLVQETLMRAYRFSQRFKEGTNFKGWLFMIMRNTFINSYRKKIWTRAVIDSSGDISDQDLFVGAVENASPGKLMLDDIGKAISKLPESYRYPFVAYFEGYKYGEIADELGIPLGTVKTHIYMAREILKKQLKNYSMNAIL